MKNIILCTDGTWNGPDEKSDDGLPSPSNMQKFFERLQGSSPLQANQKEREVQYLDAGQQVKQCAKYISGVGDSNNLLIRIAEGSTGLGLLARVIRGYTYISRMYEDGDHIYLLGFSRGAYTARALGGLIARKGLLDWKGMGLAGSNDASAYAAGMLAWSEYRNNSTASAKIGFIELINNLVTAIRADLLTDEAHAPPLKLRPSTELVAIGVWDTVGALGIPLYVQQDGTRPDLFQFSDQDLSPAVSFGFHALAVDEERVDFTPTFWNQRDGVTQVLFPGAHADVGGGYPESNPASGNLESGLSDGALKWMLKKMSSVGVLLKPYDDVQPNAKGVLHQPWLRPPYLVRPQQLRNFDKSLGYDLAISQSVLDRCAAGPVIVEGARDSLYRPMNLQDYLEPNQCSAMPQVRVEP